MALFTEPKHFGGAALRSVTDWAHYNQVIPQHPEFAAKRYAVVSSSSPILLREGLEDPLLMAHGMIDTNVHFQDIVRLTRD